jgi:hypothetical protein
MPRLTGKDATSCSGVDVCGAGGIRAIFSARVGGGSLREDSGGDFFEWWCGELVKRFFCS